MTTYIALLRAINLAGVNRVRMPDLLEVVAGLGLKDGRTLLQSGNLLFRGETRPGAELEQLLETATIKRCAVTTDFFVRTSAEWKHAIAANPFPDQAREDPGHLLLFCLKAKPPREAVTGLQRAITGREVVRLEGRHAYIVYPDGVGRSRLTSTVIEKHLGTRATGRNWNTVLKLGALS